MRANLSDPANYVFPEEAGFWRASIRAKRHRAPTGHLVEYTDPQTGNITGIVTVVSREVNSLTMPAGFYDKKRVAGAVGTFFEKYVAYVLGGSRSSNANALCPDVQLNTKNRAHALLFEVKSGHRTGGIVLKKRQLDTFVRLSNCSYAVVFHQSENIQERWAPKEEEEEGSQETKAKRTSAKRTIRKELENDYSSLFIVPPELLLKFYTEHKHREQPMPSRYMQPSEDTFVSLKESHMRKLFDEYDGPLKKISYGRFHIISNDLELDHTREKPPYIFIK